MIIRRHTPEDFRDIAELRWLLKTGDGTEAGTADKQRFIEPYLSHLAASEQRGETVHWLAEESGEVAGAMTVRLVLKEPSPGQSTAAWGYLTNSYVIANRRNEGIGSRMLAAITRWARADGLELLIVWPSERSYPFYRRAGFTGRDDPLELVLNADES